MSAGAGTRRPRIAFWSQPEYFRFMYEHDLDDFADVFELKMRIGMTLADFAPLIEFAPDYTFFFRGEYAPRDVLERLGGVKVALSSEPFPRYVEGRREQTADSVARYHVFRPIRNLPFDYVFHYDAASLPFFEEDGLHLSGHFAFPAATSVYRRRTVPQPWDVFFIGRSTAHRERFFGALKHYKQFLHICHGVWGPALVDHMCAAKVCLNVHAENEVSWEPRMQMMLACGVFVVSERITPNPYLRPGVDYVQADSPPMMYEAVEHYLADDAARERIAASGAARVRELLDARTRFADLVAGIEAGRFERFRAGRPSAALTLAHSTRTRWNQLKSRLRLR